jgi:hypothetical protein
MVTQLNPAEDIKPTSISYRRPNLVWSTSTIVQLADNMGTTSLVGVLFPDGDFRQDNTNAGQQMVINQTAVLTTAGRQGGLKSGDSLTANTYYAVYAVKITDSKTLYTTVGTTLHPTSANKAALDTAFGVNGYVFICPIAYGDNAGATTGIVPFTQAGAMIIWTNSATTNSGRNMPGLKIAAQAGGVSVALRYTAVFGTTVGNLPPTCLLAYWMGISNLNLAGAPREVQFGPQALTGASGTDPIIGSVSAGNVSTNFAWWNGASVGSAIANSGGQTPTYEIHLGGMIDSVLTASGGSTF